MHPHAYRPVICIGVLAIVVLIVAALDPPRPAWNGRRLLDLRVEGRPDFSMRDLIVSNLEHYRMTLERFDTNIRLQAAMMVLSLLLIIRRTDSLSFLGNTIPLSWLHLLAPAILGYLWLSFGFTLDDLIETRVTGVHLIDRADGAWLGPLAPDSFAGLAKSLYRDSGFIDGWFIQYIDGPGRDFSGIAHNFTSTTGIFLMVVLGSLVSASHASMLSVCIVGARRYLSRLVHRWTYVYYGLLLVPLAILVPSHWVFAFGGENRNWIQIYIGLATPVFTGMMVWLSLVFDGKNADGLLCLMRQCSVRPDAASDLDAGSRPRVVLIGDSLSTLFSVGSLPAMLPRMWGAWRHSWFHGVNGSIVDRLSASCRLEARHGGAVGARVDAGAPRTLLDRLLNRWNFSHQVDEVLQSSCPELVLVWIGHNNVDHMAFQAHWGDEDVLEFGRDYRRQLERLVAHAVDGERAVTIVAFGLVHFASFFEARRLAGHTRAGDRGRYPSYERCFRHFESMRSADGRAGMVALAERFNEQIRLACEANRRVPRARVRVVYSDAFARVPIARERYLSPIDGWHPSAEGHARMARNAWPVVAREAAALVTRIRAAGAAPGRPEDSPDRRDTPTTRPMTPERRGTPPP